MQRKILVKTKVRKINGTVYVLVPFYIARKIESKEPYIDLDTGNIVWQ